VNIKNKIAIVTGASSGIGWATAQLLAQKGAKVVLAARSLAKLQALSRQLPNSFVIQTDMTDEKQIKNLIQKALKEFGRIDILVNNAGRGYDAFIEEIEAERFKELFSLDLLGPVIAMQEIIPAMKKQGEGAIVNISSGTALMALPGMGAYSSLKRALVGISLTAREELKNDNISVSVIYPYITATDFEKNTLKSKRIQSQNEEGDWQVKADPPELIAEKVLEAIETGKAELFAHDWMGKGDIIFM
jgi:short-subunit dehydrogenase